MEIVNVDNFVRAETSRMFDSVVAQVGLNTWSHARIERECDAVVAITARLPNDALHEALHHIHDVGRVRTGLGDGVPTQRGSVAQLNVSDGGVPKIPVERIDVTRSGVVGDRQDDTRHHGRPFQALCLWGVDVIEALRHEGHPIHAGDAGENVTVDGLRWADIRPGAIVAVGDHVRIEISAYSTPCAKNARWFSDRDHRRIDHDRHPGWSRLYATVLSPGEVAVGDEVVVEP